MSLAPSSSGSNASVGRAVAAAAKEAGNAPQKQARGGGTGVGSTGGSAAAHRYANGGQSFFYIADGSNSRASKKISPVYYGHDRCSLLTLWDLTYSFRFALWPYPFPEFAQYLTDFSRSSLRPYPFPELFSSGFDVIFSLYTITFQEPHELFTKFVFVFFLASSLTFLPSNPGRTSEKSATFARRER